MYNLHSHELFLKFLMWKIKTLFFFIFLGSSSQRARSDNCNVRLVFYLLIIFYSFLDFIL
jgi:hypothetical protein